MALTDIVCKNIKSEEKIKKFYDEKGLYLEVWPNGGKYWRMKYRFAGKEKKLAFGVYPEVSLKEARGRSDEARRMLRDGVDPSQNKKEKKILHMLQNQNSFEKVALEWHGARIGGWTPKHAIKVLRRFQLDVFPSLGYRPVNEISAPELLSVIRVIENRGAFDLAHRVLQCCGQIFRYAIATGKAERDVAADLRGALKTRKTNHHAYLKAVDLPEFFKKLEAFDGRLQTKLALRLLALTFVRTGELRAAKWNEIDFNGEEWRIPSERMKMKQLHIVPLSRQAIAILKQLMELDAQDFIFPNKNNPLKYMSENTILYALYRMGYHSQTTGHGFRSTASTILNEKGFRADVIERQLAHGERNKVRAAYNHAQHLQDRRDMMQWWADYLDEVASARLQLD